MKVILPTTRNLQRAAAAGMLCWLAAGAWAESQIARQRRPIPQRPPSRSEPLLSTDPRPPGRPLDLNRYCRDRYAGGGARAGTMEAVVIEPRDAYSWRCRHTWGESTSFREIDVAEACTLQWGPWAEVQLGSRSDPYSWSCTLPPATGVEPVIDYILVVDTGDEAVGIGGDKAVNRKGELELFFAVRHLSPQCNGESYYAGKYRGCKDWAFNKKMQVEGLNTDDRWPRYDIGHRMPRVDLHSGDALLVEWFGREHDVARTYEECGTATGTGAIVIPVTKLFSEEESWGIGHHTPDGAIGFNLPPELRHLECDGGLFLKIAYTIDKIE